MNRPLDPELWKRVDRIVADALAFDASARDEFIERECDGEVELLAEVRSLLLADARTRGFLDPESSPVFNPPAEDEDAWIGRKVGAFVVERHLGSGGMGRVFAARQENPAREAAIKIMRQRLLRSADVRRFEHEAETLARLQHPCVAHVYASGLVADPLAPGLELPYFAMELVPGARSITDYAAGEQLDLRARLELFQQVCEGVEHAHQRGVLHRDLKPSNLIVDADGRARVIDFGIALTLDSAAERTRTSAGLVVGTVQYMSPQQCSGARHEDVDLRSDVYSLGLVLYELVAGARPYDLSDTSIYEAVRIIKDVDPDPPSKLNPTCRGDLDVIVLKALRKEPEERYASVHELTEDLRRYLRREPIVARRPSLLHRARLFAVRNPLGAVASLAAVVGIFGGVALATVFGFSEARASREARRRERVANEVNDFLNRDLLGAIDPYTTADPDIRVRDVLDAAAEKVDGRFPNEPLVEAGVRRSLAGAYGSIGQASQGLPLMERALALFEHELGADSSELHAVRFDLACLELDTGYRERAELRLQELLEDMPAVEVELRAQALGTLGQIRTEAGDLEAGLELSEAAYELNVTNFGAEHVTSLILANNVAQAKASMGRLDEAELLLEEVAEDSRAVMGAENPRTAYSLGNLAIVHLNQGDYAKARELLQEALEIHLETGGELHEGTLVTRRNLALVYLNLGRLEDSEAQVLAALDGYEQAIEVEHRELVAAKLVLGQLRLKQGNTAEAEIILWETYASGCESIGSTHAVTREAALHLARSMAARGARGEAIELLASVVEDALEAGLSDETTLALMNYQAALLMDEERYEEAGPVLDEVVIRMRGSLGTHPGTAVSLRNYGRCLVMLERYDEAEEVLVEGHAMAVELFGQGHGLTKQIGALFVRMYEALGLEEQAGEWRARS